jgi:hypothetical protein
MARSLEELGKSVEYSVDRSVGPKIAGFDGVATITMRG